MSNNAYSSLFSCDQEFQAKAIFNWEAPVPSASSTAIALQQPMVTNSAIPIAIPTANAATSPLQWANHSHAGNIQGLDMAASASSSIQNAFPASNVGSPLLAHLFAHLKVNACNDPARELYNRHFNRGAIPDTWLSQPIRYPMRLGIASMLYYNALDSSAIARPMQSFDNLTVALELPDLPYGQSSFFTSEDSSQSAPASQGIPADTLSLLSTSPLENVPCAICGATNDLLCNLVHLSAQAQAGNAGASSSVSNDPSAMSSTPETISPIPASGTVSDVSDQQIHSVAARSGTDRRRRARARRSEALRASASPSLSAEAADPEEL
ncbi:hypothetical protein LPJ64_003416 [Coemansia asiatica]|uniref:Uncharacterized protein n=1 Tax=Coemansia asiatica TaxID=1052880 RepID=A0A9W7XJR8_9FUNG|nr:hypothetical protein LPJ64_003416 [Coemansia asiatica]